MSSYYPACPTNQSATCRFVDGPMLSTCMWSPIVRDREGKPVDGGRNIMTAQVSCQTCRKHWKSSQTELAVAQGEPREWQEIGA